MSPPEHKVCGRFELFLSVGSLWGIAPLPVALSPVGSQLLAIPLVATPLARFLQFKLGFAGYRAFLFGLNMGF